MRTPPNRDVILGFILIFVLSWLLLAYIWFLLFLHAILVLIAVALIRKPQKVSGAVIFAAFILSIGSVVHDLVLLL
jgi:hypothetical protein